MERTMIHIDEEKCVGCGLCVAACHEGAIGMVDGKAKLLREDYCDGLGNCLPACPTKAISFVQREAPAFVAHAEAKAAPAPQGGCPGSRVAVMPQAAAAQPAGGGAVPAVSRLAQWPVQIKLVPVNAPYFNGARLLVAADCTAFAYAALHEEFMKNHITLIGCPKLDEEDYSVKLTEILRQNAIKSVTVVRMEVPCCGGLENAVKTALQNSGKMIPWQVASISTQGQLLDE